MQDTWYCICDSCGEFSDQLAGAMKSGYGVQCTCGGEIKPVWNYDGQQNDLVKWSKKEYALMMKKEEKENLKKHRKKRPRRKRRS